MGATSAGIGTESVTPPWLRAAPDVRGRVKAGLRFGLDLLFVAVFVGVALYILQVVFHIHPDQSVLPSIGLLLASQSVIALTTVVAPTALMVAITRDGPTSFGWGTGNRMRNLAVGVASGLAVMALLIGLIAVFHGVSVHLTSSPPGAVIWHGLGYLLVFALVAISEEGLLRGYLLVALSRAISFWPAAVISSVVFALLHSPRGGETLSGLVHVSLVGLLLAYSFWRSGSLWFAWGWHGAWDFTETFVFGAPDSGVPARDSLLVTLLHGPVWLSGGSAGPEGSWLVLPILALVAVIIHLTLRHSPSDEQQRLDLAGASARPNTNSA